MLKKITHSSLLKYIVKRLLMAILVLFLVSVIVFAARAIRSLPRSVPTATFPRKTTTASPRPWAWTSPIRYSI